MEANTTITKGRDGWEARTIISLGAPHILEVRTSTTQRGLVTRATRYKAERGMMSYELFGDFSENVTVTKDRCTEKSVTTQHRAALADIESIKAKCAAFYAAKAAKAA